MMNVLKHCRGLCFYIGRGREEISQYSSIMSCGKFWFSIICPFICVEQV